MQTLIQYNIDESAARVIHTFWRAWRALRRWRLIQKAIFLRATSAACVIQTSFRGMLSRTVTNSCVVTLSWLYMVALRFLRRRPGAWFIRLHDDLLSQVPQLLVGPRRWTFAEKPAHLGRSLTIQLVHEASALLATRIGRGGTARQRVSVIRLEATRRRLEVVRRRRALCDTAARLIQRVSRGFCDRREYTRRRLQEMRPTRPVYLRITNDGLTPVVHCGYFCLPMDSRCRIFALSSMAHSKKLESSIRRTRVNSSV